MRIGGIEINATAAILAAFLVSTTESLKVNHH
jgi:hypothetical protein